LAHRNNMTSAERSARDLEILNLAFSGATRRQIAERFGLHEGSISAIVNREADIDYICNHGDTLFVPCCRLEK